MSDQRADWLTNLVGEARAGGEVVGRGRFRLDWTRALDKIKRFQLADPHCYVLEIIQGAVAGGATRVDVTTTPDDLIITFDGARPSRDELASVLENLFSQDAELIPLRQLALGVNAALALEPSFVRVDSGDGTTAHRLQLSGYDDLTVTTLPPQDGVDGVRVQVRDQMSWRVVTDIFRTGSFAAGGVEVRLIRNHCRFAPVPITVNGVPITTGIGMAAMAEQRFTGEVSGAVILPATPIRGPDIAVCMNGVEIVRLDTSPPTWPRDLGVAGYIDDPGLTRNASHSDVHRDRRFSALVATLERHVRALLDGFARTCLMDGNDDLDDVDRQYLVHAAQVLLGARKPGGSRGGKLSAAQEALLDVPDVVELAVEDPATCALRPIWDAFQQTGVVHTAFRRYAVPLDALPPGTYPVLGPSWVIDRVFDDGAVEYVEPLLQTAWRGQRRRRMREARRRPPELLDHEAFVQVPIKGPYGIRGEFGLTARVEPTITRLFEGGGGGGPHGSRPPSAVLVVFMRDGVALGARWIESSVHLGVALLECPAFEPDVEWSDVVTTPAVEAIGQVLEAAVPRLVEAMATRFDTLPPPANMRDAGAFSPHPGHEKQVLKSIAARWPVNPLAEDVRTQIDVLLGSRRITRAEAPSLYSWPIFHTLDGLAVSLDQIAGTVAVPGYGVVKLHDWTVASAVAWGAPGGPVLNLSALQELSLRRQLGRMFSSADARVAAAREEQRRRTAMEARRKRLRSRAEIRPTPELAAGDYEVTIQVTVPGGRGQVGIPRLGVTISRLQPICDGLPLADQQLDSSIPMHAVVASDRITADSAFERPMIDAGYRAVVDAVLAVQPALIGAFAEMPAARTPDGEELLWQYLSTLDVPRRDPLSGVPVPLADHPLLRTVDGRQISLRELTSRAQHAEFRYVLADHGERQASHHPIVVCSPEQRRTIARLTGLRGRDYTRELREELAVLARKRRGRQRAVLREPVVLRVALTSAEFDGEVGIPAALVDRPGDGGWVDVLIDGVPLERRSIAFDGLPVIGVISSHTLRADAAWRHVVRDQAWTRAVQALHHAVDALVQRACELANSDVRDVDVPALRIAIQRMAAACFRGRPGAPLTASTGLQGAVAGAPIWEPVNRRGTVSLHDISAQWKRTRRVWIVSGGADQFAPHRLVVRGGDATRAALQQIYGTGVRDGAEVVERDRAAIQRRATAPALDTARLAGITEPAQVIARGGPRELAIRAQVAAPAGYAHADRGIRAVLGVEGRRLGEHVFAHRLRGAAYVDCTGLDVNTDWTDPADGAQLAWINEHLATALWRSVASAVRADVSADDEDRRELLIEVLAEVLAGRGPDDLRASLMAAPLFRTVQGTLLSGDELRAREDAGETIHAVSDRLQAGDPSDGRLIVRAGERGLEALQLLVGFSLDRDDSRWRRETETMAAERAFHRRPPVDSITVTAVTDQALLWRGALDGPSMEGEVAIPAVVGERIELHLFVDHRHISTLELPAICRAVVALQSTEVTPSSRYDAIVRDRKLMLVEHRVREAVWDAIAQLAAGEPSPAARTVLIHALGAAYRSKATARAFGRMRDALERAPLFVDVRGRMWSLRSLRSAIPRNVAVRHVSPHAATLVEAPDDVVLVVDDAIQAPLRRLMRLADQDNGDLERDHAPQRWEAVAEPERDEATARGDARAAVKQRPADSTHIRLLSTLKSMLREAGGRHFTRGVVEQMRLGTLGGRGELVRVDGGIVVVNRDHVMWKKVAAVEAADAPDAIRHLAIAIVSYLADQRGLFGAASAVRILERLVTP